MKFKVNGRDFIKSLVIGSSMSGKNKTLPLLDNVLFEVRDDSTLVMTSFNGECGVESSIPCVSLECEEGERRSFLVNASVLTSYVSSLRDEFFSIEVGSETITIGHLKGKGEFPVSDSSDFPVVSAFSVRGKGLTMKVDATALGKVLSEALPFVAKDLLRPSITGVNMELRDGGQSLRFVATDTKMLYLDSLPLYGVSGEGSVIVPSLVVGLLLKCLTKVEEGDKVVVSFDKEYVAFTMGETTVASLAVVGAFPKVDSIIPTSYGESMTMDVEGLLDSVTRLSMVTNVASGLLTMEKNLMGLVIRGEDLGLGKRAEETLEPLGSEGGDLSVGVKGTNLATVLKSVTTANVRIEGNGSRKALVIREDTEGGNASHKVMLLMPMLVK